MKRKNLSKRTRFEVFKRDGFACQYCGRTPPSILLVIDHVIAVASGGGNEQANLLTSCEDCNQGKSDIPLTASLPNIGRQLERERERKEQTDEYNQLLLAQKFQEDGHIKQLGSAWWKSIEGKDGYIFGPARIPSVRTFVKRLPITKVWEALEIGLQWHHTHKWAGEDRAWLYFCGVCWRMIKED